MTDSSDVSRARLGAKMTLDAHVPPVASDAESGNAELGNLLKDIRNRRFAQTTRLMHWLEAHDPGFVRPQDTSVASGEPDSDRQVSAAADSELTSAVEPDSRATLAGDSAGDSKGGSVTEVIHISPELIRFRVSRPPDFDFRAGQSVKVGLGGIQRSYSIVSAPHEPFLEFFVELAPGGRMSEQLRHLSVGSRVALGPAKGGLRFDETCPEQVMIATVTGINPFISMVRDYLHQGLSGHRFHILHGASYQTEFGYHDELASLASAYPDVIHYIPTVSRPDAPANAAWTGEVGRVDAITDDYLNRNELEPATAGIYACGHSGMVDATVQLCRKNGFQVWTESYD